MAFAAAGSRSRPLGSPRSRSAERERKQQAGKTVVMGRPRSGQQADRVTEGQAKGQGHRQTGEVRDGPKMVHRKVIVTHCRQKLKQTTLLNSTAGL